MITQFNHCRVFDGHSETLIDNVSVIIENETIREITPNPQPIEGARQIDCSGKVLMPGLIDAHIHAYTPTFSFYNNDRMPPSLMANHAATILEGMLQRGFTSVRDAAGGDRGLWMAIEQGLIKGPRFFFPGKALSQTGGHGDMRPGEVTEPCGCGSYSGMISMVADGADAVRQAAREQLRQGAHHIKIFASGGVTSPSDPIWMNQFTEEEIRAVVYEAETHRAYVIAHCHTEEAIRRCVEFGVRSIEHGSDIGPETAAMIAEKGAYVVPTLAVVDVIRNHGEELNLPPSSLEKVMGLYENMQRSIRNCTEAGVKLGLGADLLDHKYHSLQANELTLRGEINTPIEVLRSATSINAEILQQKDKLGCIKPGAYADLLVVDGNPLEDLKLFKSESNIPIIMKNGEFIRDVLSTQ